MVNSDNSDKVDFEKDICWKSTRF